MDAAPVIARGHNVAVFVPPVAEAARAVLEPAAARPALLLAPDADRATALASFVPGALAVTGLTRAESRLKHQVPDAVAAGVLEALALLHRSALVPAGFKLVVIAWPELLDEEGTSALAAIMSECDKDAQRIILTSETGPATDRLVERYAFKAMTYGFPSADPAAAPAQPLGPARYVVARASQVPDVTRRILDALNPGPDDAVVIARTPASRAEAAQLLERAGAAPPVVIAEAHELPWLRTLFTPLSHVVLPTASDAAEHRAEKLRTRIARVLDGENLERELFMVAPLFERYDPALVAAGLLRIVSSQQGQAPAARGGAEAAPAPQGVPSFAKVWIGAGRKDNVKPGDLVGAIVNEAKVPSEALGKIDLRDLFALVEVRAELAEKVARGLTGVNLRGRRLTARVDRGPGPGHRPPRRA